jgi:tellurite resistance protein TerC
MGLESIGTPLLWIGFTVFVLAMLALDLGVVHRQAHTVRMREALLWTGVWIALALVFNVGVYIWFGSERAFEFLTGYLIEKALSVDNIFVFLVVFSVFAVPATLQHRVFSGGSSVRSSYAPSSSCLARRYSSNSTGLATCLERSWCSRASSC